MTTRTHHFSSLKPSRRGTIAVELMILGPVIAVLSLTASGAVPQTEILWSTLSVLAVYLLYRVSGDLSRSR